LQRSKRIYSLTISLLCGAKEISINCPCSVVTSKMP
jgi:hypothetical protein